ncbi:hybrid sensor histidine kinase/response regulator [Natronorubrum sp. DTA7]|uniref:hybrid sensor histidine kinase/response regulator n=1 Tax=Natronorubrum sp. DTA7 TaxID=3447016 RepID=UPI003F84A67A
MTDESALEVVLVEDDDDEATLIERLLREHRLDRLERSARVTRYRIRRVDRIADALELLREESVDAVLLDLHLPDSRGLETVSTVVAHAPTVPIVVLTGQEGEDVGTAAIQRGAQDYLEKGTVSGELLYRALRYAIERKRQQQALVETNHGLALLNRIVGNDVRNEMSVVLGWADAVEAHLDTGGADAFEAMRTAMDNVVDLTDTAADAVATLDATGRVARDPISLDAVLEAEVERFRETRPDATVELARSGSDDRPLTVAATPLLSSAIEQLLASLARAGTGSSPTFVVTVTPGDGTATVTIRGDPVALPADQRAFLSETGGETSGEPGSNVGLYLVRAVIEQIGGEIEASVQGRVTSVSVRFDVAEEAS